MQSFDSYDYRVMINNRVVIDRLRCVVDGTPTHKYTITDYRINKIQKREKWYRSQLSRRVNLMRVNRLRSAVALISCRANFVVYSIYFMGPLS